MGGTEQPTRAERCVRWSGMRGKVCEEVEYGSGVEPKGSRRGRKAKSSGVGWAER